MNYHRILKDFSIAVISQGISMLLSVVTSLLVPKVLGVAEFGYWQLFIFYISYVGFFHLGLNDGVYLLKGGQTRDEIDKVSIGRQFWCGMAYQTIFAAIIGLIAILGPFEEKREFVIIVTALFMLLNNASSFIGYVFQSMNETKLFSFSVIVERLIFFVPLAFLLVARVSSFEPYVVAYAASKTCALAYCVCNARALLSPDFSNVVAAFQETRGSIRVGIKLMLANTASMLILGIARALIDSVWGIETFGQLSLSLSMVGFFSTFATQASMVLFPSLRRSAGHEQQSFFRSARNALGLFLPAVYLFCVPAIWAMTLWLPQYSQAMTFFIILLPMCVFECKMDITCTTYFKVLREEKLLLRINAATVIASATFSCLGAYLFNSVFLVIAGAVVSFILRSTYSEYLLSKQLGVSTTSITPEEILLTIMFVVTAYTLPGYASVAIYASAYILFLYINRDTLLCTIGQLRRMGASK